MRRTLRAGVSALAALGMAGAMALAGVPAGASVVLPTFTIGVDNASPSGHDYEYVDFFPRGDPAAGSAISSTVIPDNSVVDFKWNSGSPDGFHTATLLSPGVAPGPTTWGSDHPLVTSDSESPGESGQLQINPAILAPSSPGCGFGTQPACDYSGDGELNSGALPTAPGADFKVRIFLDTSEPTTIHFVCLIHPGMQGSLTVVPSESNITRSTTATMAAAASSQYAADTDEANTAESQANHKAVTNNSDGTHTITMSAGTASAHVEVAEMLPNRVEIRPGDHVKWTTGTRSDIHTVTFPQGDNAATEPVPFVCESQGGPDSDATGQPPNACADPRAFETHFNPGPFGGTVISSPSTVATSGIIANPPAPFPTSYTFTFPNSGTFAYQCRIHDNMVGTIVVNRAQANSNPATLAQTGSRSIPTALPLGAGAVLLLLGLVALRRRSIFGR